MSLMELSPLLPELFICTIAMILLMLGVFSKSNPARHITMLSIVTLVVTIYLVLGADVSTPRTFGFMFVSDSFSVLGKLLIVIGGIISLIFSLDWLEKTENKRFEYPILILFSILGMMLMISASDFLGLYMGLELSSLALYVLASFSRDKLESSEAGLKYFVLGSLASGMMLFGISLVYGFAGSTEFSVLADLFKAAEFGTATPASFPYGIIIGMILILIAFCFKTSAAPFHMWTPDVYQGSPTPVTAFFATAPKVAAIFLIIRVLMQPFAELEQHWQQVMIFVSGFSMLVGAFGALTQTNIKRMLAYSSIGHIGFALMGVAAASEKGISGVVIYISIYLSMSAGAFGCVLLMKRKGKEITDIKELSGLADNHPYLAASLGVLMFSMAGIPPLAGFFGKMYVFIAAIDADLFYLAVFGLIMSVVSCFYYLRIVKVMYFDESVEQFDRDSCRYMRLTIALCVAVSVLFVLKPVLITAPANAAIQALF